MSAYNDALDRVVADPAYASLMRGGIKLVLTVRASIYISYGRKLIVTKAAERSTQLETIREVLETMSDAFRACQRECDLYPEPQIKKLIIDLYREGISSMTLIHKTLTHRPLPRFLLSPSEREGATNDLQSKI